MTQKVSPERAAKLLNLESILTKHERLVYYDPFCRSYRVAENFDFTDPFWTGPLLERYKYVLNEPFWDRVILKLARWIIINGIDTEITPLNEIIIAALDELEKEK